MGGVARSRNFREGGRQSWLCLVFLVAPHARRDVYLWYASPWRAHFCGLRPAPTENQVFPEGRYQRYMSLYVTLLFMV